MLVNRQPQNLVAQNYKHLLHLRVSGPAWVFIWSWLDTLSGEVARYGGCHMCRPQLLKADLGKVSAGVTR